MEKNNKKFRSKTIVILAILIILIFSPTYQSLTVNNIKYYVTTDTLDSKDLTIVIHEIRQEDEIDPTGHGQADWVLKIYVNSELKSVTCSGNDVVIDEPVTWQEIITESTQELFIKMILIDDDVASDDVADISSYLGGGPDNTADAPREAWFQHIYYPKTLEWAPRDDNNDFLTDEVKDAYTWKKTSGDFDGSTGDVDENDATIWFDVLVENLPPSQPKKPEGPAYCGQYETCSYSITSGDPDEDDQIKFGLDWDGDDIIDEETGFYQSWTSVIVNHIWINTGIYDFKVIAIDIHDAISPWSEPIKVVVTPSINSPPDLPTITSGPTKGRVNKEHEFQFYTNDPEEDDLLYYIDWGDAQEGWLGPYKSSEIVSAKHTWASVGDFKVKIKAKDIYDHEKLYPWTEFQVSITRSKAMDRPFIRFLENYSSLRLLNIIEQIILSFIKL